MKRFILYRQRSVLCNVADTKHFGGKTWKSVSHKSRRPLYIVIYIYTHSRRERRCDARAGWGRLGWRSTSGAGCRKSFKELGTLFSINMYSFAICHSYVSYNHKLFCLVSWSPFFLCQKQKMKGWCTWHRIKLELRGLPLLPEALLQRRGFETMATSVVCLFVLLFCSVTSLLCIGDGNYN